MGSGEKASSRAIGSAPGIGEGGRGGLRQETENRIGTTRARLSRRGPPSGREPKDGDHHARMTPGARLDRWAVAACRLILGGVGSLLCLATLLGAKPRDGLEQVAVAGAQEAEVADLVEALREQSRFMCPEHIGKNQETL